MMDQDIRTVASELESNDVECVVRAARRLAQSAHPIQSAAIPLIRAIESPNDRVLEWCTAALERLGQPTIGDLPELAGLIREYSEGALTAGCGYWAVTLVGRLGRDALPEIDVLIEMAASAPDRIVQERAAWALGKLGPAAADASEVLSKLAERDVPRLARIAKRSLHLIGT